MITTGKFHRVLALLLLVPLLLAAITGMAYRIGRTWFGISKEAGNSILEFHDGKWLGDAFSSVYVIVSGFGLLALVATGFHFIRCGRTPGRRLTWHRILGALLMLPLAVTAITGIIYKLGKDWFGFSEASLKLVMNIHQGTWLGTEARAYYILIIGAGLLSLAATGLRMTVKKRSLETKVFEDTDS